MWVSFLNLFLTLREPSWSAGVCISCSPHRMVFLYPPTDLLLELCLWRDNWDWPFGLSHLQGCLGWKCTTQSKEVHKVLYDKLGGRALPGLLVIALSKRPHKTNLLFLFLRETTILVSHCFPLAHDPQPKDLDWKWRHKERIYWKTEWWVWLNKSIKQHHKPSNTQPLMGVWDSRSSRSAPGPVLKHWY